MKERIISHERSMAASKENVMVSIILVSYNRLDLLRDTISGVLKYFTGFPQEIILIDNDSNEPLVDTIKEEFPQLIVVANKRNVGFGAANNIGAQAAKGEYLLFINSDLIVSGNPVPEMIAMLQTNDTVGIVGCQLMNSDGSLQPSYFRFPSLMMRFLQLTGLKSAILKILPQVQYARYRAEALDFVSGAFFMIRRTLFHEINGFDEHYFMYIEDADLGYRVACRGKKSILHSSRDVVHLGANYEEDTNPFVVFHMNRGLLLFYKKNYSTPKYAALVLMSVAFYMIKIVAYSWKKDHPIQKKQYITLLRLYWRTFTRRYDFGEAFQD
ncbi:MAG: glycosyltransferase family 2 protein [Ignavibacteriae bacterium]|nr:MAG: glycosyltransferase family 2 protein [Ignavibacteriota bacterium]